MASRPKTLLAAVVPVLVGSSLAFRMNNFSALVSLVCLTCSLLIQIGTNFTNDLYDHLKGADTAERVGPLRVLSAGLVSEKQMKFAIYFTFGGSFVLGLILVSIGGLPILIIGVLSIISGIIYTAGPFSLAYNGLGDIFSFVFFGIVGTVGTFYVNTLSLSPVAFLLSVPVGALITAILVVNNYRDIEQDRKAGKHTLAVTFGMVFSKIEYIFFMGISFLIPFVLYFHYSFSLWIMLPFISLPMTVTLIRMLFKLEGEELNKLLELTAKYSALFGLLLSAGIIL